MALAGAGYGLQVQGWMFNVFITSRIYPTLDEKKKILTMYQSKNRHCWLFICVPLLNRRNLTNALLLSSSKFSFCFLKMKFFLLNSVLMRSVMTDLWGWNQENWRESFGDFMYSPIHYRVLLKIKFTIN